MRIICNEEPKVHRRETETLKARIMFWRFTLTNVSIFSHKSLKLDYFLCDRKLISRKRARVMTHE